MPSITRESVDIGATAGWIADEARDRIAKVLTSSIAQLEDDNHHLSEVQVSALFLNFMAIFDGFERAVAQELIGTLAPAGVALWGLPPHLEDLLPVDESAVSP